MARIPSTRRTVMTDSTQSRRPHAPGGDAGSCRECDPDLLDGIKCRAMGVQARADYNTAHLEALGTARDQYDGARAAYSAARTAATPLVDQVKSDLKCLLERLECLLDEDEEKRRRIVGRIRDAFWEVQDRIRECGTKMGCYLDDDCEFGDVRECGEYDVPSRLADISKRTAAAEAAFTDLIAVPTVLPTNVTALQAEVASIGDRAKGDPAFDVVVELYGAGLVARQHAHDIWRGFDTVNDFVDCVCHALTCMLRGHTAIGILTGMIAVADCQRKAREDACELLRTKTAEQVYAAYLRREREAAQGGSGGSGGSQAAPTTDSGNDRSGEDQAARDRRDARARNDSEYYAG